MPCLVRKDAKDAYLRTVNPLDHGFWFFFFRHTRHVQRNGLA